MEQRQTKTGAMAEVAEDLMGNVSFDLGHPPADTEAVVLFLGLPDLDLEAVLQDFAASRPHIDLHDVPAIAQRTWRTVECVPAAQRITQSGNAAPTSCRARP